MQAFQTIGRGLKWRREELIDWMARQSLKFQTKLFSRNVCPVCRNRIMKFLPASDHYLQMMKMYGGSLTRERETGCVTGYICPQCGATDRERLYALYLGRWFAALTKDKTISFLDFAPAKPLQKFIRKQIETAGGGITYISADLMMEGVDVKADIAEMPVFADGSIDFFICSHVLEHVPEDRRAMRELFRILSTGGEGIAMVPIVPGMKDVDEDPGVIDIAERWRRFGQGDHVRLYSKSGFLVRLKEAGFRIEELGVEYFGRELFDASGVSSQSVLYVVHKD